jgi:hypothetical protein
VDGASPTGTETAGGGTVGAVRGATLDRLTDLARA